MIIPIRCFTCGKVIGDKWNAYIKAVKEQDGESSKKVKFTVEDITLEDTESIDKMFDKNSYGGILTKIGLHRMCCRRHFLTHVDLIKNI